MDNEIIDGIESFETWKGLAGESVAPYFTTNVSERNLKTVAEWSASHIPGGFKSAKEIGFFEIGYNECLKNGLLTKDDSYIPRADRKSIYDQLYRSLTAAQARAIYENREEINPELTGSQKTDLAKIGGVVAFKTYTDAV